MSELNLLAPTLTCADVHFPCPSAPPHASQMLLPSSLQSGDRGLHGRACSMSQSIFMEGWRMLTSRSTLCSHTLSTDCHTLSGQEGTCERPSVFSVHHKDPELIFGWIQNYVDVPQENQNKSLTTAGVNYSHLHPRIPFSPLPSLSP